MAYDIDLSYFPVLLAEDDPEDQKEIINAFATINKNINITVFDNGKNALNYLLTIPDDEIPCLIIIDLSMPELNGKDLLKKLCGVDRYKEVPKIILSNSNSNTDMQQCIEDGAFAYKVKPDNFNELVNIASEMLDMCTI